MTKGYDYAVIGGGIVGGSVAAGLAGLGHRVALLDEGDVARRAARGNLGNVWVQGKGMNFPAYADLTRKAALAWPDFCRRVERESGIALHYRRPGAIVPFFDDAPARARYDNMVRLDSQCRIKSRTELLDAAQIRDLIPQIGPDVVAATYCPDDGSVNPLHLLRAQIAIFQRRSGTYLSDHRVSAVRPDGDGFALETAHGRVLADRVVLAAGLGNAELAPMVGIEAPIVAERGQILVTERLRPLLDCQIMDIRQTVEGSIAFGESKERVGNDDRTTQDILVTTARRAVRTLPLLRNVRVVRSWAALRIMSPDGVPIYQVGDEHPGACLVTVHSGVTLAPFHSDILPGLIAANDLGRCDDTRHFTTRRFHA